MINQLKKQQLNTILYLNFKKNYKKQKNKINNKNLFIQNYLNYFKILNKKYNKISTLQYKQNLYNIFFKNILFNQSLWIKNQNTKDTLYLNLNNKNNYNKYKFKNKNFNKIIINKNKKNINYIYIICNKTKNNLKITILNKNFKVLEKYSTGQLKPEHFQAIIQSSSMNLRKNTTSKIIKSNKIIQQNKLKGFRSNINLQEQLILKIFDNLKNNNNLKNSKIEFRFIGKNWHTFLINKIFFNLKKYNLISKFINIKFIVKHAHNGCKLKKKDFKRYNSRHIKKYF